VSVPPSLSLSRRSIWSALTFAPALNDVSKSLAPLHLYRRPAHDVGCNPNSSYYHPLPVTGHWLREEGELCYFWVVVRTAEAGVRVLGRLESGVWTVRMIRVLGDSV
jgi:hypothetical protein